MKVLSILGYAAAFAFIGVCALLTASLHDPTEPPPPAKQTGPRGPWPGGMMGRPFAFSLEEYFAARDADGDGRLTEEESATGWPTDDPERLEMRRRMFALGDTDGDGFMTIGESRASMDRIRAAFVQSRERFEALDTDDDGFVSFEEALAGSDSDDADREAVCERFERFDRDGDGYVDTRELRAGVFTDLVAGTR